MTEDYEIPTLIRNALYTVKADMYYNLCYKKENAELTRTIRDKMDFFLWNICRVELKNKVS